MFRDMRRKNQLLPAEETAIILRQGSAGVLAVAGEDGYPYAVPLSYAYKDGKLFFHCAVSGHKLDALRANPRASFCVVDQDQVCPEKYTTFFRSVVAFGKARVVEDREEKRAALLLLAEKYAPEQTAEDHSREIESAFDRVCIVELTLEHMTGKEAIELVRGKTSSV